MPIKVQVSDDNAQFKTVGEVSEPFTDDFPARVAVDGARGRYVRLAIEANAPKQLNISELEVYGR